MSAGFPNDHRPTTLPPRARARPTRATPLIQKKTTRATKRLLAVSHPLFSTNNKNVVVISFLFFSLLIIFHNKTPLSKSCEAQRRQQIIKKCVKLGVLHHSFLGRLTATSATISKEVRTYDHSVARLSGTASGPDRRLSQTTRKNTEKSLCDLL